MWDRVATEQRLAERRAARGARLKPDVGQLIEKEAENGDMEIF